VTRNTPTSVFPKTSSIGHLLTAAAKLATTMVNEQAATAGRIPVQGIRKMIGGQVGNKLQVQKYQGFVQRM